MKHLYLLLVLTLLGCGVFQGYVEDNIERRYYDMPEINIDSDLNEHVCDFRVDAETYDRALPLMDKLRILQFADLSNYELKEEPQSHSGNHSHAEQLFDLVGRTIGLCERFYGPFNVLKYTKITIDETLRDDKRLKATMYHELGHCVLMRPHREEGAQVIMSPTITSSRFYEKYWDFLLEDLFHNETNEPVELPIVE